MPIKNNPVYSCDECYRVKNQTNHWWISIVEKRQLKFLPFSELETLSEEEQENCHLFCGQNCATTAFGRFLDNLSLDKPVRDYYGNTNHESIQHHH